MCIEYFNELIRKMELLDSSREDFEKDDMSLPQKIKDNFKDNDEVSDIFILRTMIENTILCDQYPETQIPTGHELHAKRLEILRNHYRDDYIPLLNEFDLGTTLKGNI